jgi:NADH-quinone oxidoreductase subunit M
MPEAPIIWNPTVTTIVSTSAVILAAMYLLTMYQKVMFGPLDKAENRSPHVRDIDGRERLVFGVVILAALALGVFPKPILERTEASVQAFTTSFRDRLRDSSQAPGREAHLFPPPPAPPAAPTAAPAAPTQP